MSAVKISKAGGLSDLYDDLAPDRPRRWFPQCAAPGSDGPNAANERAQNASRWARSSASPLGIDLVQRCGVPYLPVEDQPDVLEHPQVLGHGGPADRKHPGELADGQGAVRQPLEDRLTGGVPQSGEHRAYVSHDER